MQDDTSFNSVENGPPSFIDLELESAEREAWKLKVLRGLKKDIRRKSKQQLADEAELHDMAIREGDQFVLELFEDISTFSQKEYRRRKRKADLDRIVPDRKCPMCGRIHVKSRSWVQTQHNQMICRSCYWKHGIS